jgi:choline dehydrogenase-like flavoprotein
VASRMWRRSFDGSVVLGLATRKGTAGVMAALYKDSPMTIYIPVAGRTHQSGTYRFGTDPATWVSEPHCSVGELDHLCVADAGFVPSIANPALAGMANAIGVGEDLNERLA